MEIKIENIDYRVGRLDVFDQLWLARKLGPAIPTLEGMLADRNQQKDTRLVTVILLAQLSDDVSRQVTDKCLKVVDRLQESGWAKLMTPTGSLMFTDTNLDTILELTVKVIEENVGDFFRGALTGLNEAAAKA